MLLMASIIESESISPVWAYTNAFIISASLVSIYSCLRYTSYGWNCHMLLFMLYMGDIIVYPDQPRYLHDKEDETVSQNHL